MSFITAKADEVVTLSLGRDYRVRDLTAILLSRGAGLKVIVHSFGRSALKKHSLLGTDDLQNYVYFECFKMELRNSVSIIYNVYRIRRRAMHIHNERLAIIIIIDYTCPCNCLEFDWPNYADIYCSTH